MICSWYHPALTTNFKERNWKSPFSKAKISSRQLKFFASHAMSSNLRSIEILNETRAYRTHGAFVSQSFDLLLAIVLCSLYLGTMVLAGRSIFNVGIPFEKKKYRWYLNFNWLLRLSAKLSSRKVFTTIYGSKVPKFRYMSSKASLWSSCELISIVFILFLLCS